MSVLWLGACAQLQRQNQESVPIAAVWVEALAGRAGLAGRSGVQMRIFFGYWCSDSLREVLRMQALQDTELSYELIPLDRQKSDPVGLRQQYAIPIFVVEAEDSALACIVGRSWFGLSKNFLVS